MALVSAIDGPRIPPSACTRYGLVIENEFKVPFILSRFSRVPMLGVDMILGMSWLREANANVGWLGGTVRLEKRLD